MAPRAIDELIDVLAGGRPPDCGVDLVEVARRERSVPLLFDALGRTLPGSPLVAQLESSVLAEQIATEALAQDLLEIEAALAHGGLPMIALKGPVLAQVVGGRVARESGDLDILVAEACLDDAAAVLMDLGYRASDPSAATAYRLHHHHDVPYVRDRPARTVEIHRHPLAMPLPDLVDLGPWWERSCAVEFRGRELGWLSPPDLLVHLGLHAAEAAIGCTVRDVWEVAQVAASLAPPDWPVVLDLAHEVPLVALRLDAVLGLAEESFPGSVPSDVLAELSQVVGSTRTVRRVVRRLARRRMGQRNRRWSAVALGATMHSTSARGAAAAALTTLARTGTRANRSEPFDPTAVTTLDRVIVATSRR